MRSERAVRLAAFLLLLAPSAARAQAAPPAIADAAAAAIDSRATEWMKKMSALLAGTRTFTIEAEETFDAEFARAYRVQLTNVRTLTMERPSRFSAMATGDTLHRASWYDGKSLTVLNQKRNVYASVDMPGTVDGVLDTLAADYEVYLPLSDLLYADPYAAMMEGVLYGKYLGVHQAAGVPCHHLTFGQDGLYWQIWIDAGEKPWPRKLSVASWEDSGVPRYEATVRRWVADPPKVEGQFSFKAPAGARQIQPADLARTAVATSSANP